eukprot:Clim_evm5s17 gene=Clim_evmTU5s17
MTRFAASKFKNVYGDAAKNTETWTNIKGTSSAWDSNNVAVNTTYVAVVLQAAGGGAFLVQKLDHPNRVEAETAKVVGHSGAVTDIQWNPFNDAVIASGSEDCTVKVWNIPSGGLKTDLTEAAVELHGHQRKIGHVHWHPTANNILFSTSADCTIRVWHVGKGECVKEITGHADVPFALSFNLDGSLFATTCKDKKLRVFDAHSGELKQEGDGHQGVKPSRVLWMNDQNLLLTTGASKMSERQFMVWNPEDLSKPQYQEQIDTASGVLMSFYDPDTSMLYLAGKGDGNIRYYEVLKGKPLPLNEYKTSVPARGMAFLPKRGVDVSRCEISRAFKLTATGIVEPVSFLVPRKSDQFQDDLYPETGGDNPALEADDWLSGKNGTLSKISLKDGFKATEKAGVAKVEVKLVNNTIADEQPPKGEKALTEAWHAMKKQIKELETQLATKDIKLRQLEGK